MIPLHEHVKEVMHKVRSAGWKRLMRMAPEARRALPTEDDMRRIFSIVDNDHNGTISRRVRRNIFPFALPKK